MSDPWVSVEWPAAMTRTLWDLAPQYGLRVRDHGDGPRISLAARAEGATPVALPYRRIRGVIGSAPLALDALTSWTQPPWAPAAAAANQAEIDRRLTGGSFPERISAFQLAFAVADAQDLPRLANEYLTGRLPELAGSSVYVVEAPQELHLSIISVVRMMIRAEQFPGIIQPAMTDPTRLEGGMGLISSDILGASLYLLPALAATSPVQIGTLVRRAGGSLVICFREPIRSPASRLPVSLADLHRPHYFTSPRLGLTVLGKAQEHDAEVFLPWWMDRWNRLLAELLDPATHRRADGVFDPLLMLGRYLTVQRLLSCVQSILVDTGLEEFTRMELFFEALDLMDGLGWHVGGWQQLATPSTVEARLLELRAHVLATPEIERVVIERCQRGVEAIVELRDGFRDDVTRDAAATDRAVFDLLRALRNAGHGLTKSKESRQALIDLMRHRSYMAPDLPELVWFHLVYALCFASWLRPAGRRRLAT